MFTDFGKRSRIEFSFLQGTRNPYAKNNDYVTLGPLAQWERDKNKIPIALELSTGQRQRVKKEKSNYIARGFDLSLNANPIEGVPNMPPSSSQLKIPAQVQFSDKSTEEVIVTVNCC